MPDGTDESTGGGAEEELTDRFARSSDNFGRLIANGLRTVVKAPGENDFSPERLEVFSGDTRIQLMYGTDSRYEDTFSGRLLKPGSDEVITCRTAQRATYPIGLDLIPSQAFEINGPVQAGDAVAGGFGIADLENFDPSTREWTGTEADGVMWVITEDEWPDQAYLMMVQNGDVVDEYLIDWETEADIWSRISFLWNWYDKGPAQMVETYTDTSRDRFNPQFNDLKGAVANDDGKGPGKGSHRIFGEVYQASGNSGLELEVGSMATQYVGNFPENLKVKSHTMEVTVDNTTDDTYEVVGAVKHAEGREDEEVSIQNLTFSTLPSTGTDAEVMAIAVDPSNTNFVPEDFFKPPERNEANSAIRHTTESDAAITDAEGPVEDDAGTDASGATQAATMADPGGFQIGRDKENNASQGNESRSSKASIDSNRRLPDGRWALIIVDSNESGTHEIEIRAGENT